MKKKFIYMLSVAAALLATACTDEQGVQDMPVESGKGYTMTVGASMNPASRMAIENDGKVVNYYWTADDVFTVFDFRNDQRTEFVIDSDSLTATSTKADFIGTPEKAYINGQKLYAVYNKKETVQLDTDGNVNFDLSHQNGRLNEDFQYMWGDATYKDGKPLEFVFRHLVTTLQVKMAVPDGVKTLSNVTLYSENLVSKATLVLNEAPYDTERQFGVGDLVYSYDKEGDFNYGSITLDGEFTPVDGYVTFYIYTLSAKLYYQSTTWYNQNVCPFILFTDENGLQHVSTDYLDYKEMEVGAVYSLNIENSLPLVDFENEDRAWGSVNEPYQIANDDQMFSLMMRSYLHLRDKNTNEYFHRSYQLTNDIVLDKRSIWYPIYLVSGKFDGNGKTISGELDMLAGVTDGTGLFGLLDGVTLKDLTFDADVTIVNRPGYYYNGDIGTLVGRLQWSTMQRCFSSSRMNCNINIGGNVGGLIGAAGISTIEYCGFSGEVVSVNYLYAVGGIAGCNNFRSNNISLIINGCYSNGSITTAVTCSDFGGILGTSSDPNIQITNCWSNTSLSLTNNSQILAYNLGGIVGYLRMYDSQRIENCFWNNAIAVWAGNYPDYTLENSASFEGTIPADEQLDALNYEILSSGLMFSKDNGHLVKNTQTGVPPSDIENW